MDTTLNEVVIPLNENVDEATLDELERGIRRDRCVISVGTRPTGITCWSWSMTRKSHAPPASCTPSRSAACMRN